jgi:hypothetical protein
MAKTPNKSSDIELVPDAWPRFERFIKQIAKVGPQHKAQQRKAYSENKANKKQEMQPVKSL